ncbi:hypothetical protein ZORO111903_00890 [Zobellia roscoffensis]
MGLKSIMNGNSAFMNAMSVVYIRLHYNNSWRYRKQIGLQNWELLKENIDWDRLKF